MQALLAHQLWHTGCLAGVPPESAEKMSATAQAYIIFHCSSRELQQRAGFDGWVMLLRDEFDTEDQAWPQEKLRLSGIAKRKMRRLEAGGVELDMLQLSTSSHLLLEPPRVDREEERIWCIEFFRGRMYDFVVRARPDARLAPCLAPCSARAPLQPHSPPCTFAQLRPPSPHVPRCSKSHSFTSSLRAPAASFSLIPWLRLSWIGLVPVPPPLLMSHPSSLEPAPTAAS